MMLLLFLVLGIFSLSLSRERERKGGRMDIASFQVASLRDTL
jgi:hypothetical protein